MSTTPEAVPTPNREDEYLLLGNGIIRTYAEHKESLHPDYDPVVVWEEDRAKGRIFPDMASAVKARNSEWKARDLEKAEAEAADIRTVPIDVLEEPHIVPYVEQIETESDFQRRRLLQEGLAELLFGVTGAKIERRKTELWVTEEAKKRLAADREGEQERPTVRTLSEWEADPPSPVEHRIHGMSTVGSNTIIAATYKTGKTVLGLNRVRAMVDGLPFLDRYETRQVSGSVVYLNYEVGGSQFYEWLTALGIRNRDRIVPLNLRGGGTFVQDDAAAEWLVSALRSVECEVLEFDPLSAGFRGNPNSAEDAADFLNRLDMIKKEAGVSDLFLTSHTGHLDGPQGGAERTAGSSRFMGWPDGIWTYTKGSDGTRFLSANGRDIESPEVGLAFDPVTKLLSVAGGTRKEKATERVRTAVLDFVGENPGCKTTELQAAIPFAKNNKELTSVITGLIAEGQLERKPDGSARRHYIPIPELWLEERGIDLSGVSGVVGG